MKQKVIIKLKWSYAIYIHTICFLSLLIFYLLFSSTLKPFTTGKYFYKSNSNALILWLQNYIGLPLICIAIVAFIILKLHNFYSVQKNSNPLLVMDEMGLHSNFEGMTKQIFWSEIKSIHVQKYLTYPTNQSRFERYAFHYLDIVYKDTSIDDISIPFALYDRNNLATTKPSTCVTKKEMERILKQDFHRVLSENQVILL
ncbi:hypothetical protein [Chakrabartyella piscis]|uniref:hypothetical protein n=1 Tax=Chakrabartyella piscis TaxID=2918914 RepID=UPI002958D2D5|nr:hypothetical protein [Chakrabartyella piscis]